MTDQQHARVIRNGAGLIIEDVDCEPVEGRCAYCRFAEEIEGCADHACLPNSFPADHPMRGKNVRWVGKTT